jgi:hypothetical protein
MSTAAYPPQLIELMSAAFDVAYDRVVGEPSQAHQLQLATRIMASVNAGVRDVRRLASIALGEETLDLPDEPSDAEASVEPPSAV